MAFNLFKLTCQKLNLIKISPFISLLVCFCRSWKDLTQPRSRHVLVTLWPVVDWPIKRSLVNASVQWGCKCYWVCRSTSIRYTRFHWLIYNLKRSRQEVTRTCIERGCVRSFHERQKQTESEMKGLILIRLTKGFNLCVRFFQSLFTSERATCGYLYT